MFIETRKDGKRTKHYLVHSYRDGKDVKRITHYLGSDLSEEELLKAERDAQEEMLKKIKDVHPKSFQYINDGDPWMLGEQIPDMDFFFSRVWLDGFVNTFEKYAGRAYKKILVIYRGLNLWFYFGENDCNESGEAILQKFIDEPTFAEEVNRNIIIQADRLRTFAETIPDDKLYKLSNNEIVRIYLEHNKVHQEYYQWCWIPVAVDMFHNNLTNKLMGYLEKIGAGKKASEYFAILTQPKRRSLIQEEERDLLLIAKEIINNPEQKKLFKELYLSFEEQIASKKKLAPHSPEYEQKLRDKVREIEHKINPAIYKILYKHYQTYFYVKFMFIGKEGVYSFQHFLKKVVKLVGRNAKINTLLKEMDDQIDENKKKAEEVKKQLNITGVWEKLFDGFGEFMITKIYRRYAQIFALYKMHFVLEEIAKRLDVTKADVQFMKPIEVEEALLQKKLDRNVIKKRTEFCVCYAEKGKDELYTGKKAEELAKTVERKKIEGVTEINGQTGCIGYAKGEVKIITRPSDMVKMNKGAVLVSIATDPDIVTAMKKASAIVTEQGGVTSHAAIVARELNIPCVIGTKTATQVLKDGDLVEVDATNGTITKL